MEGWLARNAGWTASAGLIRRGLHLLGGAGELAIQGLARHADLERAFALRLRISFDLIAPWSLIG